MCYTLVLLCLCCWQVVMDTETQKVLIENSKLRARVFYPDAAVSIPEYRYEALKTAVRDAKLIDGGVRLQTNWVDSFNWWFGDAAISNTHVQLAEKPAGQDKAATLKENEKLQRMVYQPGSGMVIREDVFAALKAGVEGAKREERQITGDPDFNGTYIDYRLEFEWPEDMDFQTFSATE